MDNIEMIPSHDLKRGYYVDFIKNGIPLFVICFTKTMQLYNILPSDKIIDYKSNSIKNAEEYSGIHLNDFTNKHGITYKVMDCQEVLVKNLVKICQDKVKAIYGGTTYETSLIKRDDEEVQSKDVGLKESRSFR